MQVNGTVDEAQAAMGMARAEADPRIRARQLLTRLERDLYVLMAEVTTDPSHRSKLTPGTTLVTEEMVSALEVHIDDLIGPVRDADRVRDPGRQPGLGGAGPGPHRGPAGRAPGGVATRSRAHWSVATSTGCRTSCGPWPAGPRVRTTCWPGAPPRRRDGARGRHRSRHGRSSAGSRTADHPTDGPGGTMMNIDCASAAELPGDWWLVGIPVTSDEDGPQLAADPGDWAAMAIPADARSGLVQRHGFTGKVGQTIAITTPASAEGPATDVILVGLGDATALGGDRGLESLRRASAAFVRAVGRGERAALVMPEGPTSSADRAAAAMAEGGALAAYRYDDLPYRGRPGAAGPLVVVVTDGAVGEPVAEGVARGARLAESVGLARDLVNEPPSSLTPEKFADSSCAGSPTVPACRWRCGTRIGSWPSDWAGCSAWPGVRRSHPGSSGSTTARRTPSSSTVTSLIWPWSARGSPSTPAACRSRRPAAWRP